MNVSRDRSLECIPQVKQIPRPPAVRQPNPPRPCQPPAVHGPNPPHVCRPAAPRRQRDATGVAHQPCHVTLSPAVTAATPPIRCGCLAHAVLATSLGHPRLMKTVPTAGDTRQGIPSARERPGGTGRTPPRGG